MLALMSQTKERAPHEGETLARMIREKYGEGGQTTFARKADVSTSVVTAWIKFDTLPKARWRSVQAALAANGMDASRIRDEPTVFSREKGTPEELHPLVNDWSADSLRVLRRILKATDSNRRDLLYWLEGKLAR